MGKIVKWMALFGIMAILHMDGIAQESVNAAGGDAMGSGGSASYSVGQVVYTTIGENGTTVAQGVQQAFQQPEVPIPALSEWGMIILMLLVVIFAVVAMRKEGRIKFKSLKV